MSEAPYRTKMRDSMIAIALRLLRDEGLAAVQARRIAQEAGCAVGTLYNVFGGLDQLIIEANALTLEDLGEALTRADAVTFDRPAGDRLLALALAYLHFATEHSRAWRGVFEHQMVAGADVPAWYRERQATLFGRVEAILAGAIDDPRARQSAARALFSAVHGIVALSLDRKLGDFDPQEAERQVRFVVKAVADGLARSERGQAI